MIDDAGYTTEVAAIFKRLLKGLDQVDPDVLEADSTGDMLTVVAPKSGEKVIVNTQRAVRQIWVAGKGAGIHFSHAADGRWLDDKGKGLELFTWVSECVNAATGQQLRL